MTTEQKSALARLVADAMAWYARKTMTPICGILYRSGSEPGCCPVAAACFERGQIASVSMAASYYKLPEPVVWSFVFGVDNTRPEASDDPEAHELGRQMAIHLGLGKANS